MQPVVREISLQIRDIEGRGHMITVPEGSIVSHVRTFLYNSGKITLEQAKKARFVFRGITLKDDDKVIHDHSDEIMLVMYRGPDLPVIDIHDVPGSAAHLARLAEDRAIAEREAAEDRRMFMEWYEANGYNLRKVSTTIRDVARTMSGKHLYGFEAEFASLNKQAKELFEKVDAKFMTFLGQQGGGSDIDYQQEYLKYKQRYENLKKLLED